ncbi:9356_t:CDS:1 [Gigaspora margarita]|uniref:9356_t:CDS:1 n=1 Tax=Gigaspora margarita TaxID=4874 RepID=A0ABN7V7Z4_GIGMA|nr:9356_t:CDS:1 [Gigaspora margarita]
MERKPEVTYDDIQHLFKIEKVTKQIDNYFAERRARYGKKADLLIPPGLYPPKSYECDVIRDDNTCKNIYNALKGKRFDEKGNLLTSDDNLVNESNLFGTWIYEGRKENSNSKPIEPPKPDKHDKNDLSNTVNFLTFSKHVRPLFTDCDDFNMSNLKGSKAIKFHVYEDVKEKSLRILRELKKRTMPPGVPWTDDHINLFSAWIYDGCRDDITSYMEPAWPSKYKAKMADGDLVKPADQVDLNFEDHIKPMFSKGHTEAMKKHFNLHEYIDVHRYKVEIFDRLSREENDIKLMPKNNPWPKNHVLLFYYWAIQGPNSKKDSNSEKTGPYKDNDENYQKMKRYCDQYLKYIEEGRRKSK